MMKVILIPIFLSIFTSAFAQGGPPLRLSVGYGEAVKNSNRFDNQYSKAQNSYIFSAIPFITIHYGPLNIGGGGISLSVWGDRDKNIFFNANRFGEKYYGVGMNQRKDSVFFGVGGKFNDYNFVLSKDINGRSKGIRGQVSYSQMKIFDNESVFRAAFNLEFYNSKFANYYYGVADNEVATGRSFYSPGSYLIPGISMFYAYRIIPKVNLTSIFSFKKLSNVIRQSPTTKGTDFETSGIFAISWVFY
jgi:outer membrane protein